VIDERFQTVRDGAEVHPSVILGRGVRIGFHVVIDENVKIGSGVFIGHNTVIRSGVVIGRGSVIGHSVVIEADTVIGERVTIQSQCHITARARIGDDVFFGPAAMMINTRRISHGRDFAPELEGPVVGRAARIGAGSLVMPGCVIGENSVLGAGSLLTSKKEIPAREVWFGYPAIHRGAVEEGEIL
jgi:UDP-3-O-[3-hydroxymyristoyl] glucosamine N-acyltransferase